MTKIKTEDFLKTIFNGSPVASEVCWGRRGAAGVYPVAVGPPWEAADENFFKINVFKPGVTRFGDRQVIEFRNILLEFDPPDFQKGSYQQEKEQIKHVIHDLKLPFTAATFSGNKSIHFIISLSEAVDYSQYKHWVQWLYNIIDARRSRRMRRRLPLDKSNQTPSKFSRTPNRYRKDTKEVQEPILLMEQVPNHIFGQYLFENSDCEPYKEPLRKSKWDKSEPFSEDRINGPLRRQLLECEHLGYFSREVVGSRHRFFLKLFSVYLNQGASADYVELKYAKLAEASGKLDDYVRIADWARHSIEGVEHHD